MDGFHCECDRELRGKHDISPCPIHGEKGKAEWDRAESAEALLAERTAERDQAVERLREAVTLIERKSGTDQFASDVSHDHARLLRVLAKRDTELERLREGLERIASHEAIQDSAVHPANRAKFLGNSDARAMRQIARRLLSPDPNLPGE